MSDDFEAVEPLFSYDQIGPRVSVDQAASLMHEPGIDRTYLKNQLRGFIQNRLVHVRERRGTGRTALNMLELEDVCAAKAISLVHEAGVADKELVQKVSNGLYTWRDQGRPSFFREKNYHVRSPILAALSGFLKGDFWQLRVDVMRHDQTGERHIEAFCYSPDFEEFGSDPEAGFTPRSTLVVPLYRFMPRVLRSPNEGN